jgi:hypothetical protein
MEFFGVSRGGNLRTGDDAAKRRSDFRLRSAVATRYARGGGQCYDFLKYLHQKVEKKIIPFFTQAHRFVQKKAVQHCFIMKILAESVQNWP